MRVPASAVVAGNQLLLIHGRSFDTSGAATGLPTLEKRDLPFYAVALTAGHFRGAELDLAILARDGQLFLASPRADALDPLPPSSGYKSQAAVGDLAAPRPASVSHPNAVLPQPAPLMQWKINPVSDAVNLPTPDRLIRVPAAAGDVDGLAVVAVKASLNAPAPDTQLLSSAIRIGCCACSSALNTQHVAPSRCGTFTACKPRCTSRPGIPDGRLYHTPGPAARCRSHLHYQSGWRCRGCQRE